MALLVVLASLVSVTILGQADPTYVYVNSNQEVIPPDSSASVYVSANVGGLVVRLIRVDPIAFSANQTQAIADGLQVDQKSLGASGGSYYSQQVTFENIGAGLYAAAVTEGDDVQAFDMLQSTHLGIVERAGTTRDLYWVVRVDTGEPVADVPLYRNGSLVATSDADGLAWLAHSRSALVAAGPGGVALMGGERYWYSDQQQQRVAVYSDRPLYRPGQLVHLKLVAWDANEDGFAPEPDARVNLRISTYRNGRESVIVSSNLSTNAYGSAVHDLMLDPDAALGTYTVQAAWRGQTYYGSFEVQEYRLPKFRVDVSPNDERVAVGDPLELLVAASYYYGEPLTDAKIHYSVFGSPWGWRPCHWCDYSYPSATSQPYQQNGDLELGTDGTARIRLVPDTAGAFTVRVEVTAATGERIDATARIQVEPADRLVGLELDDWVVRPNEDATLHIRLTDLAERPLTQDVEFLLYRNEWVYDATTQDYRKTQIQSTRLRVEDGRADHGFRVPSDGSYIIEVVATDERQRETKGTLWLWASGGDWGWWRGQGLEIVPARTQYEVGETIEFHVGATKALPILVTLEGGDVLDAKVLYADDRSASFEATARHTPNVWATATQLDPQTASGSPYYYSSLPTDQVSIGVVPHSHGLQVTVETDREEYLDGDTARILVQVRDAQGRPVQAEVSIAMVDEALLSLRPDRFPGLLETFYPQRYPLYPTASWYGQYWGVQEEFALGGAGGAPQAGMTTAAATGTASFDSDKSSSPPPDIKVREYFPETALWLPQLQTDRNGTLRLFAALPDSLTTWQLSVQAITRDGDAGGNESKLVTKRNLVADLFAPRFLVQGDEATIQASVANYVGELRDFQVLLEVVGADALGPDHRTITLSHGQSDVVSFPVRAADVGMMNLTFYAWSGGALPAGDAIRIRVPILPHGIESHEARAGRDAATITLTIPPSAARGASVMNVTLSPTISDALVDALPYLTGFPYGCVEQTLSRFLPTLSVASAAQTLGLNKTQIDPQIDEQVRAGLLRLYGFQHNDGAWGWWETDGTNLYTTTYVVYGLAVARDAGYDVDAEVLRRGVDALDKLSDDLRQSSPTLYAYAQFALAVADPDRVDAVPGGETATQLALGALVADRIGRPQEAASKAQRLAALAKTEQGRSHWVDQGEGWGDHGISSDTIVTALALRALVASESQAATADGAARWLLENRLGAHWYTTKDTAEAVLALVDYFRQDLEDQEPFTVTLTIDGESQQVPIDPSRLFRASRSFEVALAPGEHTVQVEPDGGRVYWSVDATYWDGEEPIRAKTSDFRLQRTLLDMDGNAIDSLQVGQEAWVRLEIEAIGARQYVQVVSPLPAGVEVVQENDPYSYYPWWHGDIFGGMSRCFDCGYWPYWSAAEIHDDHVAFFAWHLEGGYKQTFQYKVRGVFAGTYHTMPLSAQEMYHPDVRGHGDEQIVTVRAVDGAQFGRVDAQPQAVRANVYPIGEPGERLEAWTKVGSDEGPHVTFERGDEDHWTIELDAPAAPEYWLIVRTGESTVKKLIDLVPEPKPAPVRFGPSQEREWSAGEPIEVRSALAVAKTQPDFTKIFGGRQPEPIGDPDPQQKKKKGGTDGFTVAILVGALAIALASARRRAR